VLLKITNQARDYAWGSRTLISDYFGIPATGKPMAEIWFGTHPGSPAVLQGNPNQTLTEELQGHELSFLLKILAADEALSIQAHPNSHQAQQGFLRENQMGIGLDSPNRNYRDNKHKPEVIVALSDFEALCGFRPIVEIQELLSDLKTHGQSSAALAELSAGWINLLNGESGLQKLFSDVANRRGNFDGIAAELSAMADFDSRFALAEQLNKIYPGDPGVLLALFMNHVFLEPGESLFLPAGNIHAYLSGLGVEVMAASDNVLRGGLTTKHIDVNELEAVLNFTPMPVPKVRSVELSSGLIHYPCDTDDFLLYRLEPNGQRVMAEISLPGESIILCTAGEVAISNSLEESLILRRGEAAYLSGEARYFNLSGSGTAFLASSTR
jgi:mannose-6-phosphate isomerase